MTTRTKLTYALAGMLALGSTGLAFAQGNDNRDRDRDRPRDRPAERDRQDERGRAQDNKAGADLPAYFYKASELKGIRVDDKDGNRIGEVTNVAINAENGRIRYALVEKDGTLYPVPMQVLKFGNTRNRATVDTTTDRMKDAPVFKPEGWNTIGDTSWGKTVYEFYGIHRNPDEDRERPDFVPANAVIGSRVENRKGENMGTVRDIMLDTQKHMVAYSVLDFGTNNKMFAVPWQAMNVQDNGKKIVVRGVERDDLKNAPGFANSRWPTYNDLKWDKDVNFDSRPPAWIYGYSEDRSNGSDNRNRDRDPNRDRDRDNNRDNDADRGVMGGWQTHSAYGELFKRNTIERVRGRIVRSESVTPMTGMDPGTALIIRPENGNNNVLVHLGPEWFVRHQQDVFAEGDEVEVAGSRVDLEQRPVIMATELRMRGRTMTLRDDNGVPAWDAWQQRNRNN